MPDEILSYVRERLAERGIGAGNIAPPDRNHAVAVMRPTGAIHRLRLSLAYVMQKRGGDWRAEVDAEIRRQMRGEAA